MLNLSTNKSSVHACQSEVMQTEDERPESEFLWKPSRKKIAFHSLQGFFPRQVRKIHTDLSECGNTAEEMSQKCQLRLCQGKGLETTTLYRVIFFIHACWFLWSCYKMAKTLLTQHHIFQQT